MSVVPLPLASPPPRATVDQIELGDHSVFAANNALGRLISQSPTWSPLRDRVFASFWTVSLISNMGTWVHELAASYAMTTMTSDPIWVSAVRTAMALPILLLALFAGAIADRFDRRRVLILTQIFLAIVTSTMAAAMMLGVMTPGLLLATTLAIGCGMCLHVPTWQSVYPNLVARRDIPAAIALGSFSFNLARCVGPAVGGMIIAVAGCAMGFGINAISFLCVLIMLLRWRPAASRSRGGSLGSEKPVAVGTAPSGALRHRDGLLQSVGEGLSVLLRRNSIGSVYAYLAAFILPGSVVWSLIPLVATEKFGLAARGYGGLISAFGLGAIAGVIILPRVRLRYQPIAVIAVFHSLFVVGCAAVAWSDSMWVGASSMIAMGLAWMGTLTTLNSIIQLSVADHFRARAMSIYLTVMSGCMAAGSLLWGQAAAVWGLDITFFAAATLAAAMVGVGYRWFGRYLPELAVEESSVRQAA